MKHSWKSRAVTPPWQSLETSSDLRWFRYIRQVYRQKLRELEIQPAQKKLDYQQVGTTNKLGEPSKSEDKINKNMVIAVPQWCASTTLDNKLPGPTKPLWIQHKIQPKNSKSICANSEKGWQIWPQVKTCQNMSKPWYPVPLWTSH